MNSIKTNLFASTIALAAMAPMASAQSQLEDGLITGMSTVGVEVSSYEYLSVDDQAQIKAILESEKTRHRKAFEIEQIVDTSASTQGVEVMVTTPESSLRQIVEADLLALGVDIDVQALPFVEVAQIKAVLESEASTEDQTSEITAIIGG